MDGVSISFYSIASAVLFFSIGVFVIVMLRCSQRFVSKDSWYLFLFAVLLIIRVLIPLDLKAAVVINSDELYPWLAKLVYTPFFMKKFSLGLLIFVLWIVGSSIMIVKDVWRFVSEIRLVRRFILIEDQQIQKISKEAFAKDAEIFVTPNVLEPKVTGVLKPYIYLPPLDVSDQELRLILKHEICHIRGGDIIIKIICAFLKDILWWNPLAYILQSEVDNLLELRCDQAVIKDMNYQEKVSYLNTMLKVMKQIKNTNRNDYFYKSVMSFITFKSGNINKQRFHAVVEKKPFGRRKKIIMFSLSFLIFVLSYFIIIQPVYYPDIEEMAGVIDITEENAYIKEYNGVKTLYVQEEFYGIVPDEVNQLLPYSELKIIKED